MKTLSRFAAATALMAGALSGAGGLAQNPETPKSATITLRAAREPLLRVATEICRQAGATIEVDKDLREQKVS